MYSLKLDLSGLGQIQQDVMSVVAPQITQAVRMVAAAGAGMWRDRVLKARHLWDEGEKQPYIGAIKWAMDGPFAAEIDADDFEWADKIETGRPGRDLKTMLQTSQKTRISIGKKHAGQKYLIIPFRHNTPGNEALAPAMPQHIYDEVSTFRMSRVLAPGSVNPATRISGSGHVVAQHSYKWGDRLSAGWVPKKPGHKTDIYAGMVRMKTSSGKQKSSAYLTFRTMGEWSTGWLVPPRPGLYIAKQVSEDLSPIFQATMAKAIELASGLKVPV